jgi:predicted dehydrogenase
MIAVASRRRKTQMDSNGLSRKHSKLIRYAVVGLGYIAQAAVLPAFRNARKNSRLAALVSGNPRKLKSLGKKYGVKNLYSYDQYDQMLRSGEIDAVYIALPNSMHAEYTVRAADAGIHVLCEKPMAVTEDECLQMLQAAQRNNIKLMIAYRLHFDPANLDAIKIVNSAKFGEARAFQSEFSFYIKDPENIRLKRDVGGGTVYDIGIYCINAARYLFRAEPIEVFAFSVPPGTKNDPRFNEVDEMTTAVMRFPNERFASFTCSFGAADTATYRVVGTKGELCVDSAYEYVEPIVHYLTINGKTKTKKYPRHDQFAPELLHFSQCILRDLQPEPSGDEGLIDVRIIEALYHSAQIGQPVSLNVFPPDSRPGPEHEIRRPPVREPKLVEAGSPSEG